MGEARVPNPLVEQFRKGAVPQDLKLMAAQGALPLKPMDLVELLHILMADREETVRETAQTTLGGMPETELLPILKDRAAPPEILGWALEHRKEQGLREVAVLSSS